MQMKAYAKIRGSSAPAAKLVLKLHLFIQCVIMGGSHGEGCRTFYRKVFKASVKVWKSLFSSLMCTSWIQAQNSTIIIEPRQVISNNVAFLQV